MATKDLVIFRDTAENKLIETGYLKQNGELQEEVDLQALIDNLPPVLASGNLPAVRKDLISRWQSLRQGVEAIQQRGLYTVYNAEIDYSKGAIVVDNNEDLNVFYSLENNNKGNLLNNPVKWASAFNLKTITNQLSAGQVVKQSTLTYKIKEESALTQSIGFINAKDFSSYINFTTEIEVDFDTNGLNALSTNTTLSPDTWYYIYACKKADGTSAVIVDENEDGSDALIDFGNEGFDTNTMILSGTWRTDASFLVDANIKNPFVKKYIIEDNTTTSLTTIPTEYAGFPVANIEAKIDFNVLSMNVANNNWFLKGSFESGYRTIRAYQNRQAGLERFIYTNTGTFFAYTQNTSYDLRNYKLVGFTLID